MGSRWIHRLLWTLPALLLTLAGTARADDGVPDPALSSTDSAPAPLVSHWYGGRLLLADGASIAVVASGGSLNSPPLVVAGLAGWFLASPILHAEHTTVGRGALSLAARLGLPALGLALGMKSADGCWRDPNASDTCDIGAGALGLFLGVIVAEVLDVSVLARDAHAVEPPSGREHAFANLVVVPEQGGAVMGLAGRF